MRKFTKALAVMMAAVMILPMSACGKKEDPKAVFDAAVKKNAEMTDMDVTSSVKLAFTQGEETVDMTTDMKIKTNQLNTDKMQYMASMDMNIAGQSVSTEMFYADGFYYMDMAGQKIKYPMDLDKIMETVKQSTDTMNMSSADMKEITLKADGDNKVLTYTADPEKMNTVVSDLMAGMSSQMGAAGDLNMTFKEASGTYTVNKDGYYTAMTMKVTFDMDIAGETASVVMDLTGTVNNPGQAVEITLPDTADYTEIDAAAAAAAGLTQ